MHEVQKTKLALNIKNVQMTNEGRYTNHRPQLTDDKTLIKLYHKEKRNGFTV